MEGWRNNLIPPQELKEEIKRVSEERLAICRGCIFNSDVAKSKGIHVKLTSALRTDEHCMECGCTLSAKTKCLSCECPLKIPKWAAVLNDEEDTLIETLTKDESVSQ